MSELDQARRAPKGVALAAAGLSALALSGAAKAQDPDPTPPPPLPPSSGIGQYVEDVPSASGPRAAGQATSRRAALSKKAREQLSEVDSSTAQELERIATASEYGAPEIKPKPRASSPEIKPKPRASSPEQDDPSAGSAVASAVRGDENGSLDVLLAALALFTVGAVGAAVVRARRARAG